VCAAREPRRHAGLLLVALLWVGDLPPAEAAAVAAVRRWSYSAASPHLTPASILGVGVRCTWPFAPRTSAFSRSEKPRTCQPCSVKMLNGVAPHPARGLPAPPLAPPAPPHPAVVRVIVHERNGTSYGSGTLVDVRDDFGLVLTNWHVVRDASGPIEVLFPDGFHSTARARKVDRNWDLAALVIWRPQVAPVSLALTPPHPGDVLTIAGYGRGQYRLAVGRCTQYVAPGRDQPYEMVEVGVAARQGDSGGPIFNRQGDLAGVLFGSGGGTTTGAYCGRVGGFLADLGPGVGHRSTEIVARVEPESVAAAPATVAASDRQYRPANAVAEAPIGVRPTQLAANPPPRRKPAPPVVPSSPIGIAAITAVAAGPRSPEQTTVAPHDAAGQSPIEQAKTVLAVIGGVSLLLLAARAARV
jgi:hypothetical protein